MVVIFFMPPHLMLITSLTLVSSLGLFLFGAPFLPPLRPYAYPVLLVLATLGSMFILSVVLVLLYVIRKDAKLSTDDVDHSVSYPKSYSVLEEPIVRPRSVRKRKTSKRS